MHPTIPTPIQASGVAAIGPTQRASSCATLRAAVGAAIDATEGTSQRTPVHTSFCPTPVSSWCPLSQLVRSWVCLQVMDV
eukprot:CAMPEP_0183358074 /NCGR_PEP_ID=MMETSP0164_2-20130417/48098_1 /TAXON_ID=221442 /ORGANISM="Coccolithus pelagicus ssp braarudi, Strain PLY182g" /LENGTH=79 /DNA_ID=CAMNT_0025531875 /DNA_START=1 /DNA_END=240 /DNA_ORIENTATION=+